MYNKNVKSERIRIKFRTPEEEKRRISLKIIS